MYIYLVFSEQRLQTKQSSPEPVLMIGRVTHLQEMLESQPPLGGEVDTLQQGLRQQGGPGHGIQELEAEVDHGPGLLGGFLAFESLESISFVVHILHKHKVHKSRKYNNWILLPC